MDGGDGRENLSAKERWGTIVGLLLILALPVSTYFTGSTVGSFRMFSRVVQYRMRLEAIDARETSTPVNVMTLASHARGSARAVLLGAATRAAAETHVELLGGALRDVASLVCALRRDTQTVIVTLDTRVVGDLPEAHRERVECDQRAASQVGTDNLE